MKVFFDINNLLSFVHSPRNEQYDDCMRMIKDNCTIFFTFAKSEIIKLEQSDKEDVLLWFNQMTSGIKKENTEPIKWESLFPTRPLDISKFKPDQLTSVYCLSKESDPKLESNINKGNILIACEGKEAEVLSSLFIDSNQYSKNIFHKISSWNDLKKYISPCTDIIIADPYFLSCPELYQQNIYSLIRTLGSKAKNSKINIVIFTLKENYDQTSRQTIVPDWDDIYTKIRKCADKYSSFNVTFVTASKDTLEEHDRTIFTNYKSYASGDSFYYYGSTGAKLTKGRWLHAHSHADRDNESYAMKFIQDMQDIIDSIKKKNNPNLIKKDKISNFLSF